jgi:hypothetical protein
MRGIDAGGAGFACRGGEAQRAGGGFRGRGALAWVGLALALSACVPRVHRLAPYDEDAHLARQLEDRAAADCAARRGATIPPNPFKTDGCSMWPNSKWVDCCVEHDIHYWCGGSSEERRRADRELRDCVRDYASRTASVMYVGVRIGGGPCQPFPWRWGYGW